VGVRDLLFFVGAVRWELVLRRSPLLASARRWVVPLLASALPRGWLVQQLLASALKRRRMTLQWKVLVLRGLRWALLAKASQAQRRARPR
jgi:hypothetical protein